MDLFFSNRIFRQLTLNGWVSSFGDTVFYLAFISYVSSYSFAPLAITLITASETVPKVLDFFLGSLADFQQHRTKKWLAISFCKIVLYSLVGLLLLTVQHSLTVVLLICLINLLSDTISHFASRMTEALYMRVIQEDRAGAMGFQQATSSAMSILGNLVGGVLIGWLSIEAIAGINVLTFVFAFLGLFLIRTSLKQIEAGMTFRKKLTLKNYGAHMKESLITLLGMRDVVLLLGIGLVGSAVINSAYALIAMLLNQNPFLGLTTGQTLSLFSAICSVCLIIGNFLSGLILKQLSLKHLLMTGQFIILLVSIGFLTGHYGLLFSSIFLYLLVLGFTIPRNQAYVFTLIPEESMGAISAAIGLIDITLPGLLTMTAVALAGVSGVFVASLFFLFLLSISGYFLLTVPFKNL